MPKTCLEKAEKMANTNTFTTEKDSSGILQDFWFMYICEEVKPAKYVV